MNITEIYRIALLKGIEPYNKSKLQIIREIQTKEGFETCFGTKMFNCTQYDCLWKTDCQGISNSIGRLNYED